MHLAFFSSHFLYSISVKIPFFYHYHFPSHVCCCLSMQWEVLIRDLLALFEPVFTFLFPNLSYPHLTTEELECFLDEFHRCLHHVSYFRFFLPKMVYIMRLVLLCFPCSCIGVMGQMKQLAKKKIKKNRNLTLVPNNYPQKPPPNPHRFLPFYHYVYRWFHAVTLFPGNNFGSKFETS